MYTSPMHHKCYFFLHAVLTLNSVKNMVAESSIMKNLNHPNVLSLLGVCIDTNDEDMLKLILPFMDLGDLRNFLIRSRADPSNAEQFTRVCDQHAL